jgi:hypothetical protein
MFQETFSDTFPVHKSLKKEEGLLALLFSFTSEFSIRKSQAKQQGFKGNKNISSPSLFIIVIN